MTLPSTPAFQPKTGMRFITLLTIVTLAHVLVIVLLLTHIGWFSGAVGETEENSGQSGWVIPITLESADKTADKTSDETAAETADESTDETPEEKERPSEFKLAPTPAPSAEPEGIPHASEVPAESVAPPAPVAPPSPPSTSRARTTVETTTAPRPQQARTPGATRAVGTATPDALPIIPARVDPNYLHRPNPIYPAISKRFQEAGTVLLLVSLDASGAVRDVTVQTSSAFQRLDQAALEAVRQWRFIPASSGQQTVASTVLVPIDFSLKTVTKN